MSRNIYYGLYRKRHQFEYVGRNVREGALIQSPGVSVGDKGWVSGPSFLTKHIYIYIYLVIFSCRAQLTVPLLNWQPPGFIPRPKTVRSESEIMAIIMLTNFRQCPASPPRKPDHPSRQGKRVHEPVDVSLKPTHVGLPDSGAGKKPVE